MADGAPGPITQLLNAASDGDSDAAAELLPLIYGELHRVAQARMAMQRPGATLQPTALVSEAFIKLSEGEFAFHDREEFFRFSGRVMRFVLIEYARRVMAEKRGGKTADISLDEEPRLELADGSQLDLPRLLSLDQALTGLEKNDPRAAHIVELKFFGGL